MQRGNTVVYGIFTDRTALERAVSDLKLAGFRSEDVSVLFASPETTRQFAVQNTTKAPEGAATGALAGAAVGGTLGWLVGIGSIAIPGAGPFIAAGPIMAALAGTGVGGTLGGVTGALVGLGIPEYEASRYAGRVQDGGMLLSVHADDSDWADKAEDIVKRAGAEDISTKGQSAADAKVRVNE
jgi:hypothetical protein